MSVSKDAQFEKMAAEQVLSSLLSRLSIADNKTEALDELKTIITTLAPADLRDIIPNISIGNVFDCLNTNDKSQQLACGEVLDRMLSTLSSSAVLENFHSHLLEWVSLPDDSIKTLGLSQIARLSRDVPDELCQYDNLILAVVSLLPSSCLDLGPASAQILTHLGHDPDGLQVVFSDAVVEKISSAMQKNDVTRFRVYQMAIDLSSITPAALEICVRSGLLQQLINETLRDNDILVQLNAIELVSDLARCPHGLAYLDTQGVVSKLQGLMADIQANPMAGLLLPGLIKFYGGLAGSHPKEVLSKFPSFVQAVLSNVESSDCSLKHLAIDTIGFIASTPEGKLALDKLGNPMTECVQAMGRMIRTGTSETKTRVLEALARLMRLLVEDQTTELLDLTERWFKTANSNGLETIRTIAQQPFTDLRVAAFHVFHSIASSPWGQTLMDAAAGFKEYILDRSTENSKEEKEEKFELVRILAHSPTSQEILGRPYHVKLMEYFNQGPFFVLAQSEVAMEGES